jgi:hypothetical protein
MTPQEINILIAEFEGWSKIENTHTIMMGELWKGYPPEGTKCIVGNKLPISNYYEDLNAIHGAAAKLTTQERQHVYIRELHKQKKEMSYFDCIQATAPQRCEALLRTIGKWRD